MNKYDFLTANGGQRPAVRKVLATAIKDTLMAFEGAIDTEKGVAIPMGVDAGTGLTIYAILAPVVSTKLEVTRKPKAEVAEKEVEVIEAPVIRFGK